MSTYAKKVNRSNPIFKNRVNVIAGGPIRTEISIPDNLTICTSCNENVAEGYLVYLSRNELEEGRPYDYYCEKCLKEWFPKAVIVS